MGFDCIVAGGGPAGLSAAARIAQSGASVVVLEQNHDIGSPVRTSGGSFIDELDRLGIPSSLYHPVSRVRFVAPATQVVFDYAEPRLCILDVRGTFQYLATQAADAGAMIRLSTAATGLLSRDKIVAGVQTRTEPIEARLTIDATGYRSTLLKQGGLDPGFQRFGVGAEYDMHAPNCDQREALLIVGGRYAPSGYAWVFPWGRNRVRVGVGLIHPDSRENPGAYLDRLVAGAKDLGVDLRRAQPIEHHSGLIPSEQFAKRIVGDGIMGIGDAAGHASSLVGEGIRWAIEAGRMAGDVASQALAGGNTSAKALEPFQKAWNKRFGSDLRLAYKINRRIARWDDDKWNRRTEWLRGLTTDEFTEALKTNLTNGVVTSFLRRRLIPF